MNLWERVISFLLREKRYGDESRMIALYPNDNSLLDLLEYQQTLKETHDFSNMRELGVEEFHATVRWWKYAKGGDDKKIIKKLENFQSKEIESEIVSVSPLGDSLSFMLESDEMQDIFSMVDDVVRSCGAPPSDFPSYKPHVALFYDDSFREGFDPSIVEVPKFPIVFDRLSFVNNNDDILFTAKMDRF